MMGTCPCWPLGPDFDRDFGEGSELGLFQRSPCLIATRSLPASLSLISCLQWSCAFFSLFSLECILLVSLWLSLTLRSLIRVQPAFQATSTLGSRPQRV